MRLVSFTTKNYRSITEGYKLPIGDLVVLVGPNNEGKSNLLRALAVAFRHIAAASERQRFSLVRRLRREPYSEARYEWERDFPLSLQDARPNGRSEFVLEFVLTDEEKQAFLSATGQRLDANLKLKVLLPPEKDKEIEILLSGPAKRALQARRDVVAAFVTERIYFEFIPAIRSNRLAMEVIDESVTRELSSLILEPEYQAAISKIRESQNPHLERLSDEVTATIQSFLPSIRRVTIEGEADLGRILRQSTRVLVDDGSRTELSLKGDGIQSLVAIALLRHTARKANQSRGLVLAIEEPESHLHPDAIHQLSWVLQEISRTEQVLLTTHSPLLVEKTELSKNIIVQKRRAKAATKIAEIREALGVRVEDNLMSASVVLLVEGTGERELIGEWIRAASASLSRRLQNGQLAIQSLGGVTKLSAIAQLYKTLVCSVVGFVDNDQEARAARDRAVDDKLLETADILFMTLPKKSESEFEDWIEPQIYWASLEAEFGVQLSRSIFERAKKKWSDALEAELARKNQVLTEAAKRKAKEIVRLAATRAKAHGLRSSARLDGLVDVLTGRFEKARSEKRTANTEKSVGVSAE